MTYKQIHGCAMGIPVSPAVANLCMEVIENAAIETNPTKPKTWKHFVDDSFSMIKKTAIKYNRGHMLVKQEDRFKLEKRNIFGM